MTGGCPPRYVWAPRLHFAALCCTASGDEWTPARSGLELVHGCMALPRHGTTVGRTKHRAYFGIAHRRIGISNSTMAKSRRQPSAKPAAAPSEKRAAAGRKRKPDEEEEAGVPEEPAPPVREVRRRVAVEAEELQPVSHPSHGKVGDSFGPCSCCCKLCLTRQTQSNTTAGRRPTNAGRPPAGPAPCWRADARPDLHVRHRGVWPAGVWR